MSGQVPREVTGDVLLFVWRVVRWPGTWTRLGDHRSRRGLRHERGSVLAVVAAATACGGHDEVTAIAQWAADAPEPVLAAWGAKPDPLTGAISAPKNKPVRVPLTKRDSRLALV